MGQSSYEEEVLSKMGFSKSTPELPISQGSFLLSVGQDLDFVSRNQGITIKLLKVDLDYTINERYRFFVPKIEGTKCYQNEEVICGRSHNNHVATSDNWVVTLNKEPFIN